MATELSTVKQCLDAIGVTVGSLVACDVVTEEWSVIKKTYFRKILKCHPDKGGSVEVFRHVQAAFEGLRLMYDRAPASFANALNSPVDGKRMADVAGRSAPSWEYYESAAADVIPKYRVEPAKSNRSSCSAKGIAKHCHDETIMLGSVRVGMLDSDSGKYGRWVHLSCWRVPSKVWLGTQSLGEDISRIEAALVSMNEILFCGLGELDPASRRRVAAHVMDKTNWAKKIKSNSPPLPLRAQGAAAGAQGSGLVAATGGSSTAMVPGGGTGSEVVLQRRVFQIPKPGRDGRPGSMNLCTCVMTGIFPEVGGGAGLDMGKDKVKAMIESFGGRVTGAISGKTNILVVGKEPGYSAVVEARNSKRIRLIDLQDLTDSLRQGFVQIGQSALASCATVEIQDFSDGWHGNSKAKTATPNELEFAKRGDGKHLKHASSSSRAIMGPGTASPAAYRATPGSMVPFSTPAKVRDVWTDYASLGWRKLTSPSRPGQVMYLAPDGKRYKNLPPLKAPALALANTPHHGTTDAATGKRKAVAVVKTFIFVKYDDKEIVKRLGARFDMQAKKWYVNPGKDLEPFMKWLSNAADEPPAKRAKTGGMF